MTVLVGTLGTTNTTSYGPGTAGQEVGSLFTASASGSATQMSCTISDISSGADGGPFLLAIYNAAGTTLLGYTNPFTPAVGTNTAALVSAVSIASGTQYLLSIVSSSNSIDCYTTGSGYNDYYNNITYSSPPPSTFTLGSKAGNGFISITAQSSSTFTPEPVDSNGKLLISNGKIVTGALMLMPLSWTINRRNKLARERRSGKREVN